MSFPQVPSPSTTRCSPIEKIYRCHPPGRVSVCRAAFTGTDRKALTHYLSGALWWRATSATTPVEKDFVQLKEEIGSSITLVIVGSIGASVGVGFKFIAVMGGMDEGIVITIIKPSANLQYLPVHISSHHNIIDFFRDISPPHLPMLPPSPEQLAMRRSFKTLPRQGRRRSFYSGMPHEPDTDQDHERRFAAHSTAVSVNTPGFSLIHGKQSVPIPSVRHMLLVNTLAKATTGLLIGHLPEAGSQSLGFASHDDAGGKTVAYCTKVYAHDKTRTELGVCLHKDVMLDTITQNSSFSILLAAASGGLVVWTVSSLLRHGQREAFLPPGPPTSFLLGNMPMWPKTTPHLKFTEWAGEYGEIFSLKLAHRTFIVLSSFDAIHEILDKRSAVSSDRPPHHIKDCVDGQSNNLVLGRYTPRWRSLRRAAQQVLRLQACQDHIEIQQAEGVQLAYDLLREPGRVREHLRRYSTSVIMSVMFGIRTPRSTTPMFIELWDMLEKNTHLVAPTLQPPIDTFPILKYVPERWASWKRKCRELKALQKKVLGKMLDLVKERLSEGLGNGSFMEEVCAKAEEWGLDEDALLPFGFVMIGAGADTTASFLQNFSLFLAADPDIQQKAQEEMDRVVGLNRMPELADFDNLPYLQAVVYETHRFRPVTPLAVPHAASEDIKYGDYLIPKGSVIFQNTWGLFHDPNVFEDPDAFNPERFVKDPELRKYVERVFGSGRRFCVGIHLAENSIKFNTMNLIWAFRILQETSNIDIQAHETAQEGLVQSPKELLISLKVRSQHHETVLRRAMRATTEAFRPFEYNLSPSDKAYAENCRRDAC